jgi:hypothetical protein
MSSIKMSTVTDADAKKRVLDEETRQLFEEIRAREKVYEEQRQYDWMLYGHDETQPKYWEIYTHMFQHFYNNLTYFKDDKKYLNEMIMIGVGLVAAAYDSSKVPGSSEFIQLAERVIGAMTIALRIEDRIVD